VRSTQRVLAVCALGLLALLLAGCGAYHSADPTRAPGPKKPSTPATTPALTPAAPLPTSVAPAPQPTPTPTSPVTRTSTTPVHRVPVTPRAKPFVQDGELEVLLEQILGAERSSYSIFVKRLTDGSGASINQDDAYRAGSLFKMYVMWEAMRQEALGALSFDETMEVTTYYKEYELGTNRVEVGDLVTVREALELMMSISDTPTGVLLQDRLGFRNVNAALNALGIEDSGLFYPDDEPIATARDVGVLLETIARWGTLPARSHTLMMDLLLSEEIDNGLRAGVPQTVAVAHKTGLLEVARHDAGIVYLDGAPYVLVVLSDRRSATNLTDQISRAVYEYYAAQASPLSAKRHPG
jgi:beta-lactamase class A